MGNEHGKAATATPAGIQSMDEALQKRFSKGIQFNSETHGRGGNQALHNNNIAKLSRYRITSH